MKIASNSRLSFGSILKIAWDRPALASLSSITAAHSSMVKTVSWASQIASPSNITRSPPAGADYFQNWPGGTLPAPACNQAVLLAAAGTGLRATTFQGVRLRLRVRLRRGAMAAASRAHPLSRRLGVGHDHSLEAMIAVRAMQAVDRHAFLPLRRPGGSGSARTGLPLQDQAACFFLATSPRTILAPSTMAWSLSLAM